MKFVADDGTIFDTIEECENYERKINKLPFGRYWYENILMFDDNGTLVELDGDPNEANYLDRLSDFLAHDNVWYIIIPKECDNDIEWENICNFFEEEYSVVIPSSSGVWRWDEYEWYNFENEYKKFMNLWKPVEQYLPNMDAP